MKKRLTCLLLAMLTLLSYPLLAWSEEAPAPQAAPEPAAQTEELAVPAEEPAAQAAAGAAAPEVANQFPIYVNGLAVPDAHSLLENGTTYVSVTAVTQALFPDVASSWAGGDADVVYTGEGFTLAVRYDKHYLACNGRYLYLPGGPRLHPQDNALLVPVRTLAKALGADLAWDAGGVFLTSGVPLEPGDAFYNAADVDLLARVIQHESGSQPLAGKIAVANVILNRVSAGSRNGFADSVSGVIYQRGQFPGATNATPKAEAILAAKLALDGANVVPGALWFNGAGKSCWASKYKTHLATIGGHSFYG